MAEPHRTLLSQAVASTQPRTASYRLNPEVHQSVILGIVKRGLPTQLGSTGCISCSACHQIEDDGKLGTLEGYSGHYSIKDLGAGGERTAFGQYTDPRINPMLNNSGFRPTYGAHMEQSELCASCHNLKTPYVDAAGNVMTTSAESEFPEQMVFSEWQNSSFGTGTGKTSCQSCHMPGTNGMKISNRPRTLGARDNFSRHVMVGANSAMLDILANNKDTLGITATGFDSAITRTRNMLASAANLAIVSSNSTNGQLTVQVGVNNTSGHKFPTGYPSRRAYLHFTVKDASGNTVFESGRTNANGSIAGVDADTDLSSYEPHHEVITQQDQVQLYEPIMGDSDGNMTYTLLRSATYLKDNRIPPQGFDKHAVEHDIRVAGLAMQDNDFNDGSDTITYRIAVPQSSSYQVEVELRYQSLAYGFVQDLFLDADDPEVALFKNLYDAASLRSGVVSTASATVMP